MKEKKALLLARLFFILIATFCGTWIGVSHQRALEYSVVAFILAVFFVLIEQGTNIISSKKVLLSAMGLFAGLLFALLIYPTFPVTIMEPHKARLVCNLIFGFLGISLALKHEERLSLSRLKFIISNQGLQRNILIDTNIIIDGRLNDLVSTGFIHGNLIVPTFVLDELQLLADSVTHNKRTVGRRGLENLEELKEKSRELQIMEKDYSDIPEVDQKLIRLAKDLNGEILTNDYNLQKVASLHKVSVININELAQALRPPVFVGDKLAIQIIREGKDPTQGVGYLDDGTMVVVEEGRPFLNQIVDVQVSSILHTSAGRMVFARLQSGGGSSGHSNHQRAMHKK
jgi:uncharacterized protein YacL